MILFVGDTDESLSQVAKAFDSSACLIDRSNCRQVLDRTQKVKVAYTSCGDLPKTTAHRNWFWEILDLADQIYYHPPNQWSDHAEQFDHWSAQRITEYLLKVVHRQKNNVHGLELPDWLHNPYVELTGVRCSEQPQLWIAGCSIPHGIGVTSQQRFGEVLAKKINLSVTHLTNSGSGIPWAADQILRSDLRSGDKLIWAITAEYRFCLWQKQLIHMNPYSMQASDDRTIGDNLENMVYNATVAIHQVINFCDKIDVKLILLPTLVTETVRLLFHDCPHWHEPKYSHGFLDLGSDGIHPGHQQHAAWADFCFDLLRGDK